MPRPPSSATLAELKAAVGPGNFLDSHEDLAPYLTDFRRLYRGKTPLVLRPRSVDEVAKILLLCNRDEVAVVPHGGNTSYCGAATPDESGTQIVVSMQRLNRVRNIDAANYSMIVEVGCTLAGAQSAARDANRFFPLSLGSEGTAQIGGNLSTNAGGTAVLRYGMMRDLVLGLEVVLADGRVLSALKSLRKDNTGYDVKSLFIGAEGTLGLITAASLKLFPLAADTATAIAGIDAPDQALELLARLRTAAGDQVTSFELIPRIGVEMTVKHVPGVANPLGFDCAWYLLVELSSPNPHQALNALLTAELENSASAGIIKDAMLATSLAQAQAMWKLRESVPEAQRRHGASIKHDVSVPVSKIPELIERGGELAQRLAPEGDVVSYGHAGDGNLHFNLSQKPGADLEQFTARTHALELAMFDLVESLGGSISAEHGIGRLKAEEFARRADPVELSVMHALKRALDPKGILNPGKVLCAS
ncbi:MAG TPA: FAD-binding oxidoreductase [Steroidobacteraceae bacterium]|jgi:FAD/FMN-containing dehydrogenase|nr:FAD-binding oxidoreductase [Steroidobacteraceae bacterium]